MHDFLKKEIRITAHECYIRSLTKIFIRILEIFENLCILALFKVKYKTLNKILEIYNKSVLY